MDYSALATRTARLLTDYGQTATLTRVTPGSYSTSDGSLAAGTTATYTGSATVFDYDQRQIDGSLVRAGDRRVLLQATGGIPLPRTGDTITIASGTYQVVQARDISPAGTSVVYDLQVRGV